MVLVKPLMYMNRSGEILSNVLSWARSSLDDMVIVCDNLDLPPGICRLKQGGSSAGQRGLSSIISFAGSSCFMRMYIGIGRPDEQESVVSYVLGAPEGDDAARISGAIDRASDSILMLLHHSPGEVMSLINRKV